MLGNRQLGGEVCWILLLVLPPTDHTQTHILVHSVMMTSCSPEHHVQVFCDRKVGVKCLTPLFYVFTQERYISPDFLFNIHSSWFPHLDSLWHIHSHSLLRTSSPFGH